MSFSHHFKTIYLSFVILLTTVFFVGAVDFDTLSGPLPKIVVNNNKPYLITSDIEVPFGKTVTIEPGVIFLFQNFVGFKIMGQLIAEGDKSNPIIFTSEFDGKYLNDTSQIANPFDWNGIYIHKDGFGTRLKFCNVNYSVYGIKSDTRLIRLAPCIFKSNGKANLTLVDSLVEIEDGKAYTYVLSIRDASLEGVSIKLIKDPLSPKRKFYRIGGGSTFLVGAVASAYGFYLYRSSSKTLKELSSDDIRNTSTNSSADWKNAKKDRNLNLSAGVLGAAIAIIGGIGFTVSFTF